MACDILWNKETCGKVFWRAFGKYLPPEKKRWGGVEKERKREKRRGGEGWRGGKRGGEFP